MVQKKRKKKERVYTKIAYFPFQHKTEKTLCQSGCSRSRSHISRGVTYRDGIFVVREAVKPVDHQVKGSSSRLQITACNAIYFFLPRVSVTYSGRLHGELSGPPTQRCARVFKKVVAVDCAVGADDNHGSRCAIYTSPIPRVGTTHRGGERRHLPAPSRCPSAFQSLPATPPSPRDRGRHRGR